MSKDRFSNTSADINIESEEFEMRWGKRRRLSFGPDGGYCRRCLIFVLFPVFILPHCPTLLRSFRELTVISNFSVKSFFVASLTKESDLCLALSEASTREQTWFSSVVNCEALTGSNFVKKDLICPKVHVRAQNSFTDYFINTSNPDSPACLDSDHVWLKTEARCPLAAALT